MTIFNYDQYGYSIGIAFPINIPGYGKITNCSEWIKYEREAADVFATLQRMTERIPARPLNLKDKTI